VQGGRRGGGGSRSRGGNGGTAGRDGRGGSGGAAGGEADDRRSSQTVGVYWHSGRSKWVARVTVDGKRVLLGCHATEEAAARAYDNYVKDGFNPVKTGERTSQFKGVSWDKRRGKWQARRRMGTSLGYHATEEAAAQAYSNYVKDGVDPMRRDCTSQYKGVSWDKGKGKWGARYKETWLGYHATEEAAARAYNIEAQRVGITTLNDIPPADDTDDGINTAAPAALAPPTPAAPGNGRADQRKPATLSITIINTLAS